MSNQKSPAGDTNTVKLEVRSKSEKGFNRAGQHFGPMPTEIEVDVEKAQRIVDEPQLLVRQLGGPAITKSAGEPQDQTVFGAPATPAPMHVTPEPALQAEPKKQRGQ